MVRQNFPVKKLEDPALELAHVLADSPCAKKIQPGMKIALTVGSRGLADLSIFVKSLVDEIRNRGAHPFIVPAMGSHGGGTAEGQRGVLAQLGITEDAVGCPVRSSMETVNLGSLDNGMEVHIDKLAHEADGIVLFNRIKPHTAFRAENESGLVKILAIGLGKLSGANNCHAWGFHYMGRFIVEMARMKLEKCKILFGVGTIENACDRLSRIVVLPPEEIIEKEREYLKIAMANMPRLPLGDPAGMLASGPLDVLVVDAIGKEFSGAGMDPNITGRPTSTAISGGPSVSKIVVLDVSAKSQGNATGVAKADVITERLFKDFNFEATYANSITSGLLASAAIPMAMPNDKTAIQTAIKTCASQTPEAIRLIRVPNTLHLDYLYASEAMAPELIKRPGIEILGKAAPMEFDATGNLDKSPYYVNGPHTCLPC